MFIGTAPALPLPARSYAMLAPEEKLEALDQALSRGDARSSPSGSDIAARISRALPCQIAALEPKIGAFVHLNIDCAHVRRLTSASARWREGRPLLADRRHADRHQGHHRDRRHADRAWARRCSSAGAPSATRASVAALREAGAVIVGKTVTTEFAATEPRGTRNPHDLRRTPGGSSSGSAAGVAAGMISAGLGTQVIGSTIRPASYCGCVGFKVSVGALNRGGSYDGLSQSATGVLAATLEDAWQVAYEIAQRVPAAIPAIPACSARPARRRRASRARLAFLETAGLGRRIRRRQAGHGRRAGALHGRRHRSA